MYGYPADGVVSGSQLGRGIFSPAEYPWPRRGPSVQSREGGSAPVELCWFDPRWAINEDHEALVYGFDKS
jgi:hypothetical protein